MSRQPGRHHQALVAFRVHTACFRCQQLIFLELPTRVTLHVKTFFVWDKWLVNDEFTISRKRANGTPA